MSDDVVLSPVLDEPIDDRDSDVPELDVLDDEPLDVLESQDVDEPELDLVESITDGNSFCTFRGGSAVNKTVTVTIVIQIKKQNKN